MSWIEQIDYVQAHRLGVQLEFQTCEAYVEDIEDARSYILLL